MIKKKAKKKAWQFDLTAAFPQKHSHRKTPQKFATNTQHNAVIHEVNIFWTSNSTNVDRCFEQIN